MTTTENSRVVSESYSTPSETTSVTDQDNLITTEGSSGLVGNSDTLIRDWLPTFWANYIHDLESIWWILIWTLLTYQKVGNENYALESNADVQRRTRAAERIFHTDNLSTHIERSSLLKCSNFETFTEIIRF